MIGSWGLPDHEVRILCDAAEAFLKQKGPSNLICIFAVSLGTSTEAGVTPSMYVQVAANPHYSGPDRIESQQRTWPITVSKSGASSADWRVEY